jgi:hypothetical protein
MGRINVKGVIVGGLVAGLVLNVVDSLVWGMAGAGYGCSDAGGWETTDY